MNVLFLSISPIEHGGTASISTDLMRRFQSMGHKVYMVGSLERRLRRNTFLSEECGISVLRVKTGNNKKTNIIEKGLTNLLLPYQYIAAIKRCFRGIRFDLVLYPTPPVTQVAVVKYIKRRDGAKSYLLLKDIFPQNAVDIGMMSKSGPKGLIYRYFRRKEKKLYAASDFIGCMSQANVDFVLKHNAEVSPSRIEVCPNSIELRDRGIGEAERRALREKYELPTDRPVFIYGGNLGRPQGIPHLLSCLKAVREKNAFFLVVGDGTEYEKIRLFFEKEALPNAKLIRRLPKEDYEALVAACDVGLIFLDHRFTIPNFPSRLLSYMQAKMPVIACTDPNTDIGRVIEEGGFGWWCESKDPALFTACVDKALSAPLSELGEKGYAYLKENYTVEQSYRIIMERLS